MFWRVSLFFPFASGGRPMGREFLQQNRCTDAIVVFASSSIHLIYRISFIFPLFCIEVFLCIALYSEGEQR